MSARSTGIVVAAALLGGCVYDGHYRIEGGVRRETEGSFVAVEGAEIAVSESRVGSPAWAKTGPDGRYGLEYRFGGMGLLVWNPGDGAPVFTASAHGHRTCSVRLRRLEAEVASPCAWLRPCAPPAKGCVRVEFLLEAAPGQ